MNALKSDAIASLLQRQQQAHKQQMTVSAEDRRERIQQIINLVVNNQQVLVAAIEQDFGGRSQGFSIMNDILGSLSCLKYTRDNLTPWLENDNRQVFSPYDQLGSTARVEYQPKGSVGIIGTWNAPLYTLLAPLACALGAGNRAILKPSEVVPKTAEVLQHLFQQEIDPLLVSVVTGGVEVSAAFSALPFDHMVFTGSTAVGKKIMRAAAENLVPVTLELGGKSPVVVSESCDLIETCKRIALAKSNNGGQVCVSPDIVYVPQKMLEDFTHELLASFRGFFPQISHNSDFVPSVNRQHCQRVVELVEQARASGCKVISSHDVASLSDLVSADKRLPLQLLIAPAKDTKIMQEEIFGSALVILPYEDINQVITDINSREKPLALYYFGEDQSELETVLANTTSGGVSVNDCLMHAAMHDAPFGGVGASGMGHYHGREGFLAFSHHRTVFFAPQHDPRGEWGLLPPHHDQFKAMMTAQVVAD
ncbi:coniferyl aldehyde dehydrogenase [Cognaticolwellia beringensis]|uniref:Aldehyde dehydrogenase n=1 Tax=Cognaticolwellia beringensis TaxID=1967665 RepID=A0A222G985_9GAMM|nr:coniferyl aldehyde dehydrogenase [Cognaticolwellia beringensis]ASP48292.1 coniferyl aldehyde dehydrogenase [Cognaticolwellia beringensis]